MDNYPSLRKVVIMKKTPRYDPSVTDPLNFKPQLSALSDSVIFSIWCDSKYKDKIIIGGQDVPHGDKQHQEVFGSPQDKEYDGIHMRGSAGKAFLTRSYQKVLVKAKLIDMNTEPYVAQERNWHNSVQEKSDNARRPSRRENVPGGWKRNLGNGVNIEVPNYDAMSRMIQRIR